MTHLPLKPGEYGGPSRKYRDDDRRMLSPPRPMAVPSDAYRRERPRDDRGYTYEARSSPRAYAESYATDSYVVDYPRDGRHAESHRDRYSERERPERWDRDRDREREREHREWDRGRDRDSYLPRGNRRSRERGWDRERVRDTIRDIRREGHHGRSPPHPASRDEPDHWSQRSPHPSHRPRDSYVPRRSRSPDKARIGSRPRADSQIPAQSAARRDWDAGRERYVRSRSSSRPRRRDTSADAQSVASAGRGRTREAEETNVPRKRKRSMSPSPQRTHAPSALARSTSPDPGKPDEPRRAGRQREAEPDTRTVKDEAEFDDKSSLSPVNKPQPKPDRPPSPHPPTGPRKREVRTPQTHRDKSPETQRSPTPAKTPTTATSGRAPPTGPRSHIPPPPPARLPDIPVWNPKPSLTPELDVEMARLQQVRLSLQGECSRNSMALRRSVHELEMAAIDLRAAEQRRKIADLQLEQARAGMLGVDAEVNASGDVIV